jgi:hypothetical protein
LEWLGGPKGPRKFRITHNAQECFAHTKHSHRQDGHLRDFLGADGLQHLLSMLDVGPLLDPKEKHMPEPPDRRSFVDATRRLHIPYYEEARLYFAAAREDGHFLDSNEVAVFLPATCLAIIKRYATSSNS